MRSFACALLAVLICCGGAAPQQAAPNSISGKVHAQTFSKVYSVAAIHATDPNTPGDYPQLQILLTTDATAGCSQLVSNPKSARSLLLSLTTLSEKTWSAPSAIGAFAVTPQTGPTLGPPPGKYATILYLETDASCAPVKANNSQGTTGTVKLTAAPSAQGDAATGTFDVILDSQDRVTGTFDTTLCGSASAGACQ